MKEVINLTVEFESAEKRLMIPHSPVLGLIEAFE